MSGVASLQRPSEKQLGCDKDFRRCVDGVGDRCVQRNPVEQDAILL